MAMGASYETGQKDCNIGEFAMRLYLLGVLEATIIKSYQHDCLT